jgi:thiamine-monophosphate kinase
MAGGEMSERPSEDELIATYFAPLAGPCGLGLRDDAAVLSLAPTEDLVLTTDLLVAGVHFFAEDPPALIAKKSLRVNLSDLAAKGARPLGFLLGLALPRDWTSRWLASFAAGLGEDGAAFACPLIGGDTSMTPGPLTIAITALGAVPKGAMVPRAGAVAGDLLYVSGTIGDAALGLKLRESHETPPSWQSLLSAAAKACLADRYLLPQPRLSLAEALRENAHAAMDVSDGLAGDLAKMLRLTDMTAEIALARIPFSSAAAEALRADPGLAETLLSGGDDYEIICAVPPDRAAAFETLASAVGIAVAPIGTAREGTEPPSFRCPDGAFLRLARPSFRHF